LGFKYSKTNQLDLFSEEVPTLAIDKSTRKQFRYIRMKPMTEQQIVYGGMDVINTHKVFLLQLAKIAKYDMTRLMYLEHHYLKVLAKQELAGFYLDKDLWLLQFVRNTKQKYETEERLLKLIRDEDLDQFKNFQSVLFGEQDEVDINLASSKQVVELCKALNIPTVVKDKKKTKEQGHDVFKDSVEERHLKQYQDQYPIIKPYLEYKRFEKATSTYGDTFLEHLNPVTHRIHSNFKQNVRSGRSSSNNPNLQNVPAESKFPGFRSCFIAPTGKKLVVADYSSQESRILACLAKEEKMIDFFLNGDGDLHSHTARLMFKVPVQKEIVDEEGRVIQEGKNLYYRQLAKTINFGIAYGMSAFKLSHDFGITLEEAEEFINSYFEAYPQLEAYFRKQRELAIEKGYISIDPITNRRSWNGHLQRQYEENLGLVREYRIWGRKAPKEVFSLMNSAKGQIGRNAQNYRIQGTAASMTKLASVLVTNKLEENGLSATLVNAVHDEIVIECSEKDAEKVQQLLLESMEKAGKVFVKEIPMTADCVISEVWEH
jgi:DNA polymerase-1